MKKQLLDDIYMMLQPYIDIAQSETVRMKLIMLLDDYHIELEEKALVPFKGDKNELVLKKFVAAKFAAGCSPRTIRYYTTSIRMTLTKIGKSYDEITADDIRLYLALRVQKDHVSKTTANNERRNLSSFYCWLQKEEILLRNPMNKVDSIKETKIQRKAFTQMELELMRAACETTRETATIEMLISTWARVSEIALIRIDEIEEDGRVLVHGKGDKDRYVYLTAKAKLAIQTYLTERSDENPYLFPRHKYAGDFTQLVKSSCKSKLWYTRNELVDEENHTDPSTIEAMVRNLKKKAGIKEAYPHKFRRTGATMALRSGMPLMQVSKILGHEQIGTTQRYLDISDEELMQAHEKFVV